MITRPEESYRLWCVVLCDLETSRIGAPYIYMYVYDISSLRVKRNIQVGVKLNHISMFSVTNNSLICECF